MKDARDPHHDGNLFEHVLEHMLGEFHREQRESTDLDLATDFEYAAAALDIAVAESNPIDLPTGLIDRLMAQVPTQAEQIIQDSSSDSLPFSTESESSSWGSKTNAQSSSRGNWVPWFAAAASILIAAVAIFMPRSAPSIADLASQRLALINSTAESKLIQWQWTATEDPAVIGEVSGDLVWNDELNKGYMRISGLEANNPSELQYQLWIFDATRPSGELPQFGDGLLSQRPIDGGVFDINEAGEVIIEIDAKLTVKQAAAFAITVEPPGGVVVSDRSRLPLLALAPTS